MRAGRSDPNGPWSRTASSRQPHTEGGKGRVYESQGQRAGESTLGKSRRDRHLRGGKDLRTRPLKRVRTVLNNRTSARTNERDP